MPKIPETDLTSGCYIVKKTWSIKSFPFGFKDFPRDAVCAKAELIKFLQSRKDKRKLSVIVCE
jgi:hypothetical protein